LEKPGIRFVKQALFPVQLQRENLATETGVPLSAVKLYLGQFGHGGMVTVARSDQHRWRASSRFH
jgi:hypothetical protein